MKKYKKKQCRKKKMQIIPPEKSRDYLKAAEEWPLTPSALFGLKAFGRLQPTCFFEGLPLNAEYSSILNTKGES